MRILLLNSHLQAAKKKSMINKNRVKECRTMSEANQERSGQEIELIKERILAALEMVIDPELESTSSI